jgi:Na+-driven multidrug efflux pump
MAALYAATRSGHHWVRKHPAWWLRIFTDDAEILEVGTSYFRTIGPSYLFSVAGMVMASSF